MRAYVLISLFCLAVTQVQADHNTLKVFTWAEYFDPDLIARFEEESGIPLEFIYYGNDEVRDQVMAETQGFGFDVILVDDAELPAYIQQNWLAPLDSQALPHLQDHGEQWLDITPEADGYGVPYSWGSYGVVYRTDRVTNPPTHWADLFDPEAEWAGTLQMPAQASELIPLALMAEGFSPFSDSADHIRQAEQRILAQKPLVQSYGMPDLEADIPLLGTELVSVAVTYSSDGMFLMEYDDRLAFADIQGGNILWVDYWAISANSHQTSKALQFLNFTLQPDVAAQNVEYHYSATFSEQARQKLPETLQTDPRLYPENTADFYYYRPPSRDAIRSQMRLINRLDLN